MKRMQIGVVDPETELRGDRPLFDGSGERPEEPGFQHLLAYEHVLAAVDADWPKRPIPSRRVA
jgi:hypothetical protein